MKKVVLILVPVILLATVAALGLMGIIRIPGLSPAKAKSRAAQLYTESDPKVAVKEDKPAQATSPSTPPKTVPVTKPGPVTNLDLGQKKLAKLWNELEPPALVALTKDWKENELAPILLKMDAGKVAALLSLIDPKRASSLSRQIRQMASTVPAETANQS